MSFTALYIRKGKWDAALKYAGMGVRLHQEVLDHKLPFVPECQQCKLARLESGRSNPQIVFRLPRARPGDAATVAASAEWVLNTKGTINELLTERVRLTRGHKDPKVLAKLGRLGQVREQLSRAGFLPSSPAFIERLVAEEKELTKELGKSAFLAGRSSGWAGLDSLRASLPADAVLLDILRVSGYALSRDKSADDRYLAWLIPPKGDGEPRFFDLGPATEIDGAAAATGRLIASAEREIDTEGEAAAEKRLKQRLETLRDHLLPDAVRKILEKKRKWLISPDAALWLVPWHALPDSKGEYAVMAHDIRLLTTARNLLKPKPRLAAGPVALFSDPDYDGDGGKRDDSLVMADGRRRGLSPHALDLRNAVWKRLPGTREEGRAARPLAAKAFRTETLGYSGALATEAAFKRLRGPRAVVFMTHAVALAPPDPDADRVLLLPGEAGLRLSVPDDAKVLIGGKLFTERHRIYPVPGPPKVITLRIELSSGRVQEKMHLLRRGKTLHVEFGLGAARHLEHPLIRCGLILAGANKRHGAKADADDGILTGLEIVGTDLEGCELVVLSACETGLGDVRNAEGVAGLRQAFQLAGARRVVASLWRVPDEETASLMPRFWEALAEGKDSGEALCAGQRAYVGQRRESGSAAHPYYWAAFSITGR